MWPAADGGRAGGGEPLEVIVINDRAAVRGGCDRVALGEAAGLARRGHRVTLIAGSEEPERRLLDAGVEVRSSAQRSTLEEPNRARAAAQGIWNREAQRLVSQALGAADRRRALVHVHGFVKVLSPSVVRAAIDSGLPTLLTLHDYFLACPNGGFFDYRRARVCHLRPMSARCVATDCDARAYTHKLWRVGRSFVQEHLGRLPGGVDRLIAPSALAAEVMRAHLPGNAAIEILPNPVAVTRRPPAEVERHEGFVLVGRLQRDKGAVLFARAARKASVPAVFVGAGEEEAAIRRANPDAELTGWLDGARAAAVVRGARAAVSPSLVYETQGLAALEAAAEGVPSVVSDVSAAREAVQDGISGLWFAAGDADHLAERLVCLKDEPQLAARMGRAAYERFWSAGLDLPTHLDRLERVYRSLLASPKVAA
jgi:glycosyltransferase involved in cell wall biosynthesis